MVNKEKIISVLRQVMRQIDYMKDADFDKQANKDRLLRFRNYWSKEKVLVTIEIEEGLDEEEERTGESSQSVEEDRACAHALKH